ncbi:DUF4157 domain-containing protein [Microbacteriaceae bacterium K1510]|nr:DUF4157 domain-containing protein [Microbacteriaceae bacterium K1510]
MSHQLLPLQGSFSPAGLLQLRRWHDDLAQPRTMPRGGRAIQPSSSQAFLVPPRLSYFRRGGGQRLPSSVLQTMASLFKTDFSDVQVHVGPEASSLGALAFTQGANLYFAPGHYSPATPLGLQLLGHELTHVVQQRVGRVRNPFGSQLAVVQDRALEAEAEQMGRLASTHRVLSSVMRPVSLQQPATRAVQLAAAAGAGAGAMTKHQAFAHRIQVADKLQEGKMASGRPIRDTAKVLFEKSIEVRPAHKTSRRSRAKGTRFENELEKAAEILHLDKVSTQAYIVPRDAAGWATRYDKTKKKDVTLKIRADLSGVATPKTPNVQAGYLVVVEAKATANAPLTRNQKLSFPLMVTHGAKVLTGPLVGEEYGAGEVKVALVRRDKDGTVKVEWRKFG